MIRNAQLRCAYYTIRDREPRCISRRRYGINEINKAVMPQARHVPAAPPVHFHNGDTALLSIHTSPTYCRSHSAVVNVKNGTIRRMDVVSPLTSMRTWPQTKANSLLVVGWPP
jgi:hypothetical protein